MASNRENVRWLASRVTICEYNPWTDMYDRFVTYYPGWVDVEAFPQLAEYTVATKPR